MLPYRLKRYFYIKSSVTKKMVQLVCVFLIILISSCSQYKDPFQPIRVDFLNDHIYLMHLNNINNLHTVVLKGKFNDLLPGAVVDSVYYDYEKKLFYEDIKSFMCCQTTCQFNEDGLPQYLKEHTDFTVEEKYTWARNGNIIYRIINTNYNETDTIFYYLKDGLLKTKLKERSSKTDYFYRNNHLSKKITTELTPELCDTIEVITEEYAYWNESGKIKSIIQSYKLFDYVNHLTFNKSGFPKYVYYMEGSDTVCVLGIKMSEL